MSSLMKISANIIKYLMKSDITIEEFAERLGIDKELLLDVLHGSRIISYSQLEQSAIILNVSVDQLLDLSEE